MFVYQLILVEIVSEEEFNVLTKKEEKQWGQIPATAEKLLYENNKLNRLLEEQKETISFLQNQNKNLKKTMTEKLAANIVIRDLRKELFDLQLNLKDAETRLDRQYKTIKGLQENVALGQTRITDLIIELNKVRTKFNEMLDRISDLKDAIKNK